MCIPITIDLDKFVNSVWEKYEFYIQGKSLTSVNSVYEK